MCICWFIIYTYVIKLFNARPWNIIKLIYTIVVVVVVMVITICKITKHLTLEITLRVA